MTCLQDAFCVADGSSQVPPSFLSSIERQVVMIQSQKKNKNNIKGSRRKTAEICDWLSTVEDFCCHASLKIAALSKRRSHFFTGSVEASAGLVHKVRSYHMMFT